MLWGHYLDDWVAQGYGRRWTIVEHPDGNGRGVLQYSLWSAPLGALEVRTAEAMDCPSLEDAQKRAEEIGKAGA